MHLPTFTQALVPLTAPYIFAAPGINDGNFQKAVVNTHNADRAKHGVPNLAWDNKLAEFAQKWANNCEFKHSGGPYGENLYGSWTTGSFDFIKQTSGGIHDGWYNEITKYDFNKPGFSMGTGHFTQLVWKSTKKIGCAWNTVGCKSNGMNFYKLVCEYDPPGNMVGGTHFKDNVPRPIKKADVEAEEEEADVEEEETSSWAEVQQEVIEMLEKSQENVVEL